MERGRTIAVFGKLGTVTGFSRIALHNVSQQKGHVEEPLSGGAPSERQSCRDRADPRGLEASRSGGIEYRVMHLETIPDHFPITVRVDVNQKRNGMNIFVRFI
jgi:hypothetical protein